MVARLWFKKKEILSNFLNERLDALMVVATIFLLSFAVLLGLAAIALDIGQAVPPR